MSTSCLNTSEQRKYAGRAHSPRWRGPRGRNYTTKSHCCGQQVLPHTFKIHKWQVASVWNFIFLLFCNVGVLHSIVHVCIHEYQTHYVICTAYFLTFVLWIQMQRALNEVCAVTFLCSTFRAITKISVTFSTNLMLISL